MLPDSSEEQRGHHHRLMVAVKSEINVTWRWLDQTVGILTNHHATLVSQENTLASSYHCDVSRSSVTLMVTSRE